MLNPDQIIKNAGQIYEKLGRAYHFDDGLKSNQVRAAIIAICEEINNQNKRNPVDSIIDDIKNSN